MAVVFSDNFSSDTPGTSPAAWSGHGDVNTNGVNPTPNRACEPDPDMWVFLFPESLGVVFFGLFANSGVGGGAILVLSNTDPATPGGGNLLSVYLEDDNSLSLYTAGGQILINQMTTLPSNSAVGGNFFVPPETYVFISANFSFIKDSMTGDILVGCDLSVNGIVVASGSLNSGILATSTFTGTAAFNQLEFKNSGVNIANVTYDNSPVAPYPDPTPPAMLLPRVTQMAIETLQLPSNSNARVSQMAIETLQLPSNSNARVSQMAIELITANNPTIPGGIPEYIKRRNLFANS
jgi:hypothetical protein